MANGSARTTCACLGEGKVVACPTASAAVRSALEEAMFRNDRRASEIETLVCEFADMAEKAVDNPEIAARLDRTLDSLVPAQSLKMHGSEKIAADFRVSLAPLARRIDDLAAAASNPTASCPTNTARSTSR